MSDNIKPCGKCDDLLEDKMNYAHLRKDNLICPVCGTEWELKYDESWDGKEEECWFWMEEINK